MDCDQCYKEKRVDIVTDIYPVSPVAYFTWSDRGWPTQGDGMWADVWDDTWKVSEKNPADQAEGIQSTKVLSQEWSPAAPRWKNNTYLQHLRHGAVA